MLRDKQANAINSHSHSMVFMTPKIIFCGYLKIDWHFNCLFVAVSALKMYFMLLAKYASDVTKSRLMTTKMIKNCRNLFVQIKYVRN